MANSDKNIKITPNISQTAQPNVVFTGQGNVPITLKVLDDSYGTLSFEGSAGQLFSINNNLTSGVIFAVNDVSGIPQIDVNADGTIRLAPYGTALYVGGISGSAVTIQPSTRSSSGAGANMTLTAGSGVTTGAGGSVFLKPGAQATSGGDGTVIVQSANFSGSITYLRIQNPTTSTYYADFEVTAGVGGNNLTIEGGGVALYNVRINSSTAVDTNNAFRAVGGGYPTLSTGGVRVGYSPVLFSATQTYNFQDTVGLVHGSVGTIRVADASGSSTGSGGGSFAYTSSTPTALSANTDNLVLTGSAFQRLSASAAYNLTGIAPPSGGAHVDGRVIWLHNVGANNITLKHSQTSTAANQFINETGGDIVLAPNKSVQCTHRSYWCYWTNRCHRRHWLTG